jgi:membrane-bound serine protease (ClpP class)
MRLAITRVSIFIFVALALVPVSGHAKGAASSRFVDVMTVDEAITPITEQRIKSQIDEAEKVGAKALVIEIDTPGGLESSMRGIVKAILASEVPVISYVSPPGGRAASAGLFIVTSTHVAAMAPNTNIGAASPVAMGGQMDSTMAHKAMNDAAAFIQTLAETRGRNADWNRDAVIHAVAVSATDAVKLHVVDFIATDLKDVLVQANGRRVKVATGEITLDVAGADLRRINSTFRQRVLAWIADPTIAYLLLTLGFYGILFELQSPGAILPGVVGAIFMVLGFVALQTLPVNTAGLLLIALGIVFFALEVKVHSHGILAAGGVISFLTGSLILFEPGPAGVFRLPYPVVAGTTAATALFFLWVIGKAVGSQRRRVTTGAEAMVGQIGEVATPLAPRGQIRVRGEIWQAQSADPVPVGTAVEVVHVRGLTLEVRALRREGA